ncbi:hypothetical protein KQH60_00875 [Mycetohabitans sp. B8]|nr:hypothetical protein [Mycetohabitans sp. B8]MCG1041196.1 hypothetical protein [Mycetohabitans sp. B8]
MRNLTAEFKDVGGINIIKLIKRRAYGYRDEAYVFLNIRAAFFKNIR